MITDTRKHARTINFKIPVSKLIYNVVRFLQFLYTVDKEHCGTGHKTYVYAFPLKHVGVMGWRGGEAGCGWQLNWFYITITVAMCSVVFDNHKVEPERHIKDDITSILHTFYNLRTPKQKAKKAAEQLTTVLELQKELNLQNG